MEITAINERILLKLWFKCNDFSGKISTWQYPPLLLLLLLQVAGCTNSINTLLSEYQYLNPLF